MQVALSYRNVNNVCNDQLQRLIASYFYIRRCQSDSSVPVRKHKRNPRITILIAMQQFSIVTYTVVAYL